MPLVPDDSLARHVHGLLDAGRGLGMETGAALVLRLLFLAATYPDAHARRVALVDAAAEGGADRAAELLALQLTGAFDDIQHPQPIDSRMFADGGRALKAVDRRLVDLADRVADARGLYVELFEAVLAAQHSADTVGAEHHTPDELAELLLDVVDPDGVVLDPACGYGEVLAHAARRPGVQLRGTELSPAVAEVARMRLRLHDASAVIETWDAFQISGTATATADVVVADPPWGLKRRGFRVGGGFSEGGRALDLEWALISHMALRPGGRAAVLLPAGAGVKKAEASVRRDLLSRGIVEAVVALPERTRLTTQIGSCIWLLRGGEHPPQDVLFVNASTLGTVHADRRVVLDQAEARAVVDAVSRWRRDRSSERYESDDLARAVPIADVLGEDAKLVPQEHVSGPSVVLRPRPQPRQRLLTELAVANFKSFAEERRAPLAPITLIYGPNSSGKSSLLQTLLLLKQSIGAEALETQAGYPDLGSFTGLLHGHDESRKLQIGLRWGALSTWDDDRGVPAPAEARWARWTWGVADDGGESLAGIELAAGAMHANLRTEGDVLAASREDFDELLRALADPDVLWAPPRPGDRPKVPELLAREADAARRRSEEAIRFLQGEHADSVAFRRDGQSAGTLVVDPDAFRAAAGAAVDRRMQARPAIEAAGRLVTGISDEARRLLAELAYLGPLRQAPQRFYRRARATTLGTEGEHLANFLFDRASQVGAINEWLLALDVPYEVAVEPLQSTTIGDLVSIVLTDRRTGVRVSPADVGYGISQLLPIVVQLVVARDRVVCIEQPEIHVHPRLQAQLADLLVDAAHTEGRGNQILVETHSEHLMLRLQKHIRRGQLDADMLAILYVDRDQNGAARIRRLRLDDNGYFIDEWPAGFFDERLDELFDDLDEE